jgi:hypothetical protein
MTVLNNIEIDNITYKRNDIKFAITNNDPIENKLNVIIVISNPCLYARRYILLKEFVKRFEEEETNVELYIVELIYKNQQYLVTNKNNKNHLQIQTDVPIWHKENMVNLGVKYLLPKNWKAFAWIDADIEFENNYWALDTLKILNGCKDVVQLFSHCNDMDRDETNLNIFNGFGYSFCKNKKYCTKGLNYWHPGYAWAMTRKAYKKINGLYDKGVLGSGDNIMALSFINKCDFMINKNYNDDYIKSMLKFQEKAKQLRLGYTPGVIRHHYHGSKQNRRYTERWKVLIEHSYSPNTHVKYDKKGILIPTEHFSNEFKNDIFNYFKERKEDN